MKQNHFEYKGETYYSGAVFRVSCVDQINLQHSYDMIFIYHDPDKNKIALKIGNTINLVPSNFLDWKEFEVIKKIDVNWLQNVNSYIYKKKKEKTFVDELNIDGLFISWVWYIFIMVIAIIFKDCIGIWILSSIVFFSYRYRKLKEAGHK